MRELELNEIKQIELNIFIKFDKFCKEHNLKYTMIGGTLLGAVRHSGFIPWDDDIDIGMPREDYERLLLLISKGNIIDTNYSVTSDRGKTAVYPFIKIYDTRYIVDDESVLDKYLWIDVMPIDKVSSNPKQNYSLYKRISKLHRLFRYYYNLFSNLSGFKLFVAKLLKLYAKCIGINRIIKKINSLSQKYTSSDSELVGVVSWAQYGVGEVYESLGIENLIEMNFEGYKFYSISLWDKYLKGIYGDYMELPPVDKRKNHKIRAFEK